MCITHVRRHPGGAETNRGNAVRGPLNAVFFTVFDGYLNWILRKQKRRLFADLPGTVVELGAGVGANFRYMAPGTRLVAVEPNPHMRPGLRKRAAMAGIDLTVLPSGAEAIDLADASVDTVICTLVMCTVDDPVRVLGEVRRILKPGGRFVFLEHVAAPAGNWRRRLQILVHGPWRWLFEGCNTNRETAEVVRAAGFAAADIEDFRMRSPFIPVNTMIAGQAVA